MQGPPEDTNALRRYRLIAEIGHGGMADVYLAVAQGPAGFNKLVVIKKARKDLLGEPEILSMFLDEARLAARLNHPNVVQTHEIGQEGDRYFIAMEYLDGQPLNRILSRCGDRMPLPLKLRIFTDVLAGLHHAHELRDFDGTSLGVVHRDATPQNVFVTYDGSIKVVDFGIAKALDSSSHTRTGVVKGKVAYMAPEQVRGERLDRRTDIFAVGVMLWESIARRRMWEELPEITIVHELMHDLVPSIQVAVPHITAELARICDMAISPNREHRYGTALELARDLEDYIVSTSQRASARDVGAFIAEAFEADRAKVKAIIEQQLGDVRWQQPAARATGLELPSIEIAASGAYAKPSSFSSSGQMTERLDTGASRTSAATPPSTDASNAGVVPTNSGAALPLPLPSSPQGTRTPIVAISVAAIALAAGMALGVRILAKSEPHPAQEAAVTAAPPAARPADEPVKVSIKVRPDTARIYLDDVLLSTGTFTGKLVRAEKPRRLRIVADGYVTREEQVSFSGDFNGSFDLPKEAAAEAPSAAAPAPPRQPRRGGGARPPPSGEDPPRDGKKRPSHGIDDTSPY